MKPYKIIKTIGTLPKKAKVLTPLKKPIIPFVFFKNSFTPSKSKIVLPNQ
jgi:hypothetical protein